MDCLWWQFPSRSCGLIVLNQWVGYYPTLEKAWGDLTAGPLPDQTDAKDLPRLRNTHPDTGKLVPVDIPENGSGFKHRSEYIYLPPVWFTGDVPAKLPAVMMIAGEFSNPANWIRTQEPSDDKTKELPARRQDRLAPVGFGGPQHVKQSHD